MKGLSWQEKYQGIPDILQEKYRAFVENDFSPKRGSKPLKGGMDSRKMVHIMGKFSNSYKTWKDGTKNLFLLAMIALLGFLALLFGFFIGNPGLRLGWLLGSAIEIFAYVTIDRGSSFLLSPVADPKKGALGAFFGIFRMALYAAGLVLGGFATYRWGSMASSYCNVWTVFSGYLPMGFVLICTTFFRCKKEEVPVSNKEESKNE